MSAGRWLRDNLFLIAGIALPLLVVGFFLLATSLSRLGVPPPQHDLLITTAETQRDADRNYSVDFEIRNGRAVAVLHPKAAEGYHSWPGLYRFDHESLQLETVAIDYPDALEAGETERIIDVDVGGPVSTLLQAPDGYRVHGLEYSRSNLFNELFGGRRRSQYTIARDGRAISIPVPPDARYYQMDFLGWIE